MSHCPGDSQRFGNGGSGEVTLVLQTVQHTPAELLFAT